MVETSALVIGVALACAGVVGAVALFLVGAILARIIIELM